MSSLKILQSSVLAGFVALGCIGPQNNCGNGASSADTADNSGGGSDEEGADLALELEVEPVEPVGALMSDGTSNIVQNVEPPGSWFVFNDGSPAGEMSPPSVGEFPVAIQDSGIHSEGKGYSEWGGGIGFNFVGAQMLTPLDASKYKGIRFKASGSSPMHVALATIITMPEFGGCSKCYDHYAVDVTDLSGEPKEYEYTWKQLRQAGWGSPKAKIDPKTLVGLNFTSRGPSPWNFTVDEIGFIE
jgi:hypothetical protein